jgi:hypothetical protein
MIEYRAVCAATAEATGDTATDNIHRTHRSPIVRSRADAERAVKGVHDVQDGGGPMPAIYAECRPWRVVARVVVCSVWGEPDLVNQADEALGVAFGALLPESVS